MTPEEYIMQVKDIDLRIRSLEGELQDAEAENDTEYAEELRASINADIQKYKELKLRIREEIQQLKDNKLSALLIEYYIRGRSWEQVAFVLDCKSVKNVREGLRKRALQAFRDKYPQYFS